MQITFEINEVSRTVDVPEDMPLVWVLRDVMGLKGTKFGCGEAVCGACTVQVNGQAVRSCVYPVKYAVGKKIRTIEGISTVGTLHPVQQAWLDNQVPQCGYCQPGFIMATISLLEKIPAPTEEDIHNNITNICRCGTYPRMKKAILRAAELQSAKQPS